jgi:hypothetical protein
MADYYSIMTSAVRALDQNTGEARRRLYDRARAALIAEMHSAGLDILDIMAAQMSLEEAIGKIEADAEPDARAHTPSTVSPGARATVPGGLGVSGDRRTAAETS